jgi:hypothetical protein
MYPSNHWSLRFSSTPGSLGLMNSELANPNVPQPASKLNVHFTPAGRLVGRCFSACFSSGLGGGASWADAGEGIRKTMDKKSTRRKA